MELREGDMNTSKVGTEYELLVKNVYDCLYATEGIYNPVIQHNVTFQGKSGATHQIDLYWEFTFAGVRHRVAVECKNYKNPVKKEKIVAFDGVLKDISGNIQGIYACRNGYQKGAMLFAESCGIQLMEIRKPNDEDWKERVRDIYVEVHMSFAENYKVHFNIDTLWFQKNYPDALPKEFHIGACNSEVFIDDGQSRKSMLEIMNALPRDSEGKGFMQLFEYENAYFIYKEQSYKINKLQIEYDVHDYQDTIHICGDEVIQAIIMNSLGQGAKILAFDGSIRDRE